MASGATRSRSRAAEGRCAAGARWALVALALVAVPAAARAEQSGDELERARRLLASMNYRAACQEFRRAVEAGGLELEQLTEAYGGVAECSAALRRPDEAREAFVRLLGIAPARGVSNTSSPLLREPYEAAMSFWAGKRRPAVSFDASTNATRGAELLLEPVVERGPIPELAASVALFVRQPDGTFAPTPVVDGRAALGPAALEGRESVAVYLALLDDHGNVTALAGSATEPIEIDLAGSAGDSEATREHAGGARRLARRWWFWTAIGAGVAALVLGVALPIGLSREGDAGPCERALGGPCDYSATLHERP
jgi:hypothetical protein